MGNELRLDISRRGLKIYHSKSESIELHRAMWNFIADESLKSKSMVGKTAFGKVCKELIHMPCKCFCCGWAIASANALLSKARLNVSPCDLCPLSWEDVNSDRDRGCSIIVGEWEKATYYEYHAEVAIKIANVPERDLYVVRSKDEAGIEGEDLTLTDYKLNELICKND